MYWTIDGGVERLPGATVRDHILHHGLTLSRALRQRLFHPDDVELQACVMELFYGGLVGDKWTSRFHMLFRARVSRALFSATLAEPEDGSRERFEAAHEVTRLLGGMAGASTSYETDETVARTRVADMLWQRVDSGLLVCGQHDDCTTNDELGRACALRFWEEPLLKLQGHGT